MSPYHQASQERGEYVVLLLILKCGDGGRWMEITGKEELAGSGLTISKSGVIKSYISRSE